eukprot:1213919-Rhodomonas_salina.1
MKFGARCQCASAWPNLLARFRAQHENRQTVTQRGFGAACGGGRVQQMMRRIHDNAVTSAQDSVLLLAAPRLTGAFPDYVQ